MDFTFEAARTALIAVGAAVSWSHVQALLQELPEDLDDAESDALGAQLGLVLAKARILEETERERVVGDTTKVSANLARFLEEKGRLLVLVSHNVTRERPAALAVGAYLAPATRELTAKYRTGVRVFVGGISRGHTNNRITIDSGPHTVRIDAVGTVPQNVPAGRNDVTLHF